MHALARHRELLEAGGEIVTASARQARWLRVAFGRERARAGESVWPTPPVVPLAAWLEREARALDDRPEILSPYATLRLWEMIVADSPVAQSLVAVKATAREAARAWTLSQEWRIPVATLVPTTPEEQAFRDWALAFEQATARRGALDAARLASWLAGRLAGSQGRRIGMHGLGPATPMQRLLVAALENAGAGVEALALEGGPATPVAVETATPETEEAAVAAWIHARLAARPDARLVVLLPESGGRADALRRRLDDQLAPERLAPGAPDGRPYALAAAPALADQAVVATALDVLALGEARADLDLLGRLLRSPYLPADDAARGRRARLDVLLRRDGLPHVATAGLARRLRGLGADEPGFGAVVAGVRAELDGRRRRSASEWADAMQRALRAAGWPKGRVLGSAEYRAATQVTEGLAALGALSAFLPPLDYGAARAELAALLGATRFEPALAEANVLLLDQLEDPALPCDGLWVGGLTADRFPGHPRPTPFLSLALQRDRGLPGTAPERMITEARAMLAGWRSATDELVLSAPRQSGEERLVRSTLVPGAPFDASPPAASPRAAEVRATGRLIAWQDAPLAVLETGSFLPGGVEVLKLQAACPFRAQAQLRLGARELERPAAGLSPRLRGLVAHASLAAFWRAVRSQQELAALLPAAREAAVAEAIGRAFREHAERLPTSRFVDLERQWLTRAMLKLLDMERQRVPFAVAETEADHVVAAGGYQIRTRIDRIDRLDDGSPVVIDYKTGRAGVRRWLGPQTDAMQLAAYALALTEPPAAVAFASLTVAGGGFRGLAERDGVLPRVGTPATARRPELAGLDWSAVLAEWRRLADGFAARQGAGIATVDPAPDACDRCPLPGLCRIEAPSRAGEAAGEEEEGTGD